MSVVIVSRKRAIIRILVMLIGFVSIAASVLTVVAYIGSLREGPTLTAEAERQRLIAELERQQALVRYEAAKARMDAENLRVRLQQLQREVASVRAQTSKPLSATATTRIAADLAELRASVDKMQLRLSDTEGRLTTILNRFDALEEAIKPDALKAVSVPLLQKDLLNLRSSGLHKIWKQSAVKAIGYTI